MTVQPGESTTPKRGSFQILASLAGGVSLLNLIKDIDLISLNGTLGQWLMAYHELVVRATNFLFGWIPVKWIGIDAEEVHGLIVLSIVLAAIDNGWGSEKRLTWERFQESWSHRFPPTVTIVLFVLIMPANYHAGYWLAFGVPGWLIAYTFIFRYSPVDRGLYRPLRVEDLLPYLLRAGGWVALIVLLDKLTQ
ncbi:hypothetical protein [Catellatospora coxensis]|uniref:hypothetical protein n=1 Tax=Catellatospora coxensis TaxID=310354 RepID=UPI0019408708|nr:hypothetical protein [Catellatospora coxensis]